MKSLTILFGTSVVGIVFCLSMSIYTGIQESKERNAPPAQPIPMPALNQ